jgi:hypothetical protein
MTENATFFGARRGIAPSRHPSKKRTALQACQKCQPAAIWAGRVGYLANAGYCRAYGPILQILNDANEAGMEVQVVPQSMRLLVYCFQHHFTIRAVC